VRGLTFKDRDISPEKSRPMSEKGPQEEVQGKKGRTEGDCVRHVLGTATRGQKKSSGNLQVQKLHLSEVSGNERGVVH